MYIRLLVSLLLPLIVSVSILHCTRPKDDTPEVVVPPPDSQLTMLLDSTAFETPDGSYAETTVDSMSNTVTIAAADPDLGAIVMELPLNKLALHRPYTVVPMDSTLFSPQLRTHISFVVPPQNPGDPSEFPVTLFGENGTLTLTDIKGFAFSGKFSLNLRGIAANGRPIFYQVRSGLFSRIQRPKS